MIIRQHGFTLVEMSIVLIIIGLVVAGILVGQDMISASTIRMQIAQIDKYNSAVHTFQSKYGGLPGDITAATASQLGFAARGTYPGEGDGNGLIEGITNAAGAHNGAAETAGETLMFWVDLSQANLIDATLSAGSATTIPGLPINTTAVLSTYFPAARMGNSNSVYVFSGGYGNGNIGTNNDGNNYFDVAVITSLQNTWKMYTSPGMIVAQAFNIDSKIDDGFPMSGTVLALTNNGGFIPWVNPSYPVTGPPYTSGVGATSSTCYDNAGQGGHVQKYSTTQSQGSGINCALSFKFQ